MVVLADWSVARVTFDIWEAVMFPLKGRIAIESLLIATCRVDRDKFTGKGVGIGGVNSLTISTGCTSG